VSRAASDLFAIKTVLGIVAHGAFVFWMLVAGRWWNRGTTLSINALPDLIAISVVAGLAVLVVLRFWFRNQSDLHNVPEWNLKHDRPGLWVVVGMALSLIAAGSVAWATHLLVKTTAQHLGGQQALIEAVVQSVSVNEQLDGHCHKEATFVSRAGESFNLCIEPNIGHALSSTSVENGQTVAMTVVHNLLGTALVRVEPYDAEPFDVEAPNTSLERTHER
jgi:hypothetical protein